MNFFFWEKLTWTWEENLARFVFDSLALDSESSVAVVTPHTSDDRITYGFHKLFTHLSNFEGVRSWLVMHANQVVELNGYGKVTKHVGPS